MYIEIVIHTSYSAAVKALGKKALDAMDQTARKHKLKCCGALQHVS